MCMRVSICIYKLWLGALVASYAAQCVNSQSFEPDLAWRKPNITISPEDRVNIASTALEKAISNLTDNAQFDGELSRLVHVSLDLTSSVFGLFIFTFNFGIPVPVPITSTITTNRIPGIPFYGSAAILYAQIAEFDRLTNQTKYKDQLKGYFRSAEGLFALFLHPLCVLRYLFSDPFPPSRSEPLIGWLLNVAFPVSLNYGLTYGYAATRAYAAYKDDDFLNFATDSWTSGYNYTLKQNEVDAKSTPVKEFGISQTCQGITMAGGTFWTTDPAEPSLNGLGTGSFFVLSAALAEATSNQTFLNAAAQSLTFIHAHLYNVEGVVQDTISANEGEQCATANGVFAYNSGLMIEGLAILAEVTGNASTQQLLRETVDAAIRNDAWQGKDGVVTNGGELFCDTSTVYGLLVRGLSAAYYRNTTPSDMRNYIKDYLGVQYNAILEQATTGQTNIYGSSWVGPPYSTFYGDNQTLAISGLLAAIPLTNDTLPTNSPSGSDGDGEDGSKNSQSKSNIGPIVGGVVGGIAFLSLPVGGFFLFRKRQRSRQERQYRSEIDLTGDDANEDFAVRTPFILPEAPSASSTDSYTHTHSRTKSELNHEIRQALDSGASLPQPLSLSSLSVSQNANMSEKERIQLTRNFEDQQLQRSGGATSSSASGSGSRSGPVNANATAPAAATSDGAPNPNMSTADLVRLLNERLQPGQWTEDEVPPEYIEAGSSSGSARG
ncbi:hypothetical protein D9758_015565 [Tetrapyrgos nigripes]|uniref:Glycoside hydrolase family 76 protein n=1 Tax=Tetrapyrgos nigripes TaxID=182062 RepID=A0A8H5FIX3_9AGAR|nr:hypothetical protein D9758_015565 [Tetrapyrgos nigripes]